MKKSTLLIAGMMAVSTVHADEGMWTLYNLPQAIYEQMQAEGYSLPYSSLYYSSDAIKNAVVNFSGYCSGVVVSPDGLVFTNHHCGFEAIRSHSTVEHDYMLNGFYAKSFEEELPNKDMFVSFMVEQRDITEEIKAMGIDKMTAEEQEMFLDSIENARSKEVKAKDATLRLEIKPFYERNAYYQTTYRDFTDLRLVFTVPKSMGKFGGETDNWMWPRQTCDFSVFRIYADPETNGPAAYSEKNVPYHPEHWAQVSMEGYKDGDFAMTMGYPGSTNRYLSSYGIKERRDCQNEPRAQIRGVKQGVMIKHMRAEEAVRIKYDSKYAQSANYWKNSIGMNKCIDSIGIIEHKQDFEARIRKYMDKTGYLKGKLDFDKMARLYAQRYEPMRAVLNLRESFFGTNELGNRALQTAYGWNKIENPDAKEEQQYIIIKDNSEEWDEALDKEVLAAMLKNYEEHVDAKYLPAFYNDIKKKFKGDYTAFANNLYKKSKLMKSGEKIYINRKDFKKDPGYIFGLQLRDMYMSMVEQMGGVGEEVDEQEKYLAAARLRMEEDLPHYSDANFTMRLSYGQVGGFMLNGKPSGYYTTAESLVEKFDKQDKVIDYFAEPIMRELLTAKDFGRYTDKTTGKMQLCFLTNNDITGGNSGSPMFNGKGELIGLAFDGNWDSLSSDINFDSKLARCIGVDIRFVIFMMDKWGHADRLLKEMNVQ